MILVSLCGSSAFFRLALSADCTMRILEVIFSAKTTASNKGKSHPSPKQYTQVIMPNVAF